MLKTMHALKTVRELERLEQAGSSFLPTQVGTSELTVAHERCAELFLAGVYGAGRRHPRRSRREFDAGLLKGASNNIQGRAPGARLSRLLFNSQIFPDGLSKAHPGATAVLVDEFDAGPAVCMAPPTESHFGIAKPANEMVASPGVH